MSILEAFCATLLLSAMGWWAFVVIWLSPRAESEARRLMLGSGAKTFALMRAEHERIGRTIN